MKNEIDKFRHLACIQFEKQNAVAYDCRDVAINLRQLELKKKSQSTNTFHSERKKSFRVDVRSQKHKERQSQIMKF